MKNIILFFILFLLFFTPLAVRAAIVVNEMMYDLDGSDGGREWMEVLNNSDAAIDLSNWKFFEAETNHKLTLIQGDSNIPVHGYAIIADNSGNFLTDNPEFSGILFDSAFSLSNSGESLALKDGDLNVVDELTYNSSWGANGNGRSLQRKDPNGNSNDPNNWGSGNPTPGTTNSITPKEQTASTSQESSAQSSDQETSSTASNQPPIADAGDNVISFIDDEITFDGSKSYDPDGLDLAYEWNLGEGGVKNDTIVTHKYSYPGTYLVTLMVFDGRYYNEDTITVKIYPKKITINEFLPNPEGQDAEEEWIELYNDSDQIIDISGWQLDDEEGGSEPFIFPENTLIAPKSYLVFSRPTTDIALNNDKGKVRLLLSTGIVFQEISYEKAPEGKSSARTLEGFVWSMPTPGFPNIIGANNKELSYNQPLQTKTTGYPSENLALNYKNDENQIKGGWAYLPQQNSPEKSPENTGNLIANLNQITEKSNSKLILIILTIIIAALAIGIGVMKLKKK